MIKALLPLLPPEGEGAAWVCVLAAVLGCAIWLAGGRWSRALITLGTVTAGAYVGMRLPLWCGWTVDGMGTCVGGAMVLGFTGYTLHRFWVGVGLGTVLACWAAMGVWIVMSGALVSRGAVSVDGANARADGSADAIHWTWPKWDDVGRRDGNGQSASLENGASDSGAITGTAAALMGTNSDASRPDDAESAESASRTTLPRYLAAVWREAPADMARVLPWAAAGALAAGLILTHAWPKLGTAWFWAGLGMTILVCTSAAAVQYGNPAMMHRLHPKPWQEGAALLGLLAVGILAQWRLIQSPGDEGEPVDEDAGVPHSGAGAKKKPAAKNRAADEDD